MLDSHPGVKVYTELFLAGATGAPMWEPSDIEFVNAYWQHRRAVSRPYWTVRYLQRVFDQPDVAAVGFKYMYDQIPRSPMVLPYAAARRVRVVHLVRRNLLDSVISNQRALHTGLYHLPTDGRPQIPWAPAELDEGRIRLDPDQVLGELSRLARERERIRRWLRITRTLTLEVEYETLVRDVAAFAPMLHFLGVQDADPGRLHSGLKKLRTTPREHVVENFGELQTALAGTAFEAFLAR
jgi:LPS sulfotransferase NodH